MNNTQPITLIQLISEQTMQNLLPILRFRPAHVVHLSTHRTAPRSTDIVRAANQCGVAFQLEQIRLSVMPTIGETSRAVTRAIAAERARDHTPLVNFTGGTKLMSIGAYSAATNCSPQAITFYVDTDDERFIDGSTAEGLQQLLEGDYSFTQLHECLNVPAIAAAHGQYYVSPGREWQPFVNLARHLLDNPDQEQATFDALFGENGPFPRGVTPNSPKGWLESLDRPFTLPPEVAALAASVGLLRLVNGQCKLPDNARSVLQSLADASANREFVQGYDQQRIAATDQCQFPISFLTGGWWEVIVVEAAHRTGLFRDLRWSATVGTSKESSLEEDILAVDGVRIVVISCKRGGNKSRLLPHLDEFNARARRIGGNFTRRFLAVCKSPKNSTRKALLHRAEELGVRILTPENLTDPNTLTHGRW